MAAQITATLLILAATSFLVSFGRSLERHPDSWWFFAGSVGFLIAAVWTSPS